MLWVSVPGHHVFNSLEPSEKPVWFHLVPITETGHTGIRLKPTLKRSCLNRGYSHRRLHILIAWRRAHEGTAFGPEFYLSDIATYQEFQEQSPRSMLAAS